jgi:hypothetical protein
MLRPTVIRPVCLGLKRHLGPKTRFLLLSDTCGFVYVGRSVWRDDGSAVCNCCCRSSPAQSFSGPSAAGLMTIYYAPRFETTSAWRARSPYLYTLGTGWPRYTPRHRVPLSSPPTTHRATLEIFDPTSTLAANCLTLPDGPHYIASGRTA